MNIIRVLVYEVKDETYPRSTTLLYFNDNELGINQISSPKLKDCNNNEKQKHCIFSSVFKNFDFL